MQTFTPLVVVAALLIGRIANACHDCGCDADGADASCTPHAHEEGVGHDHAHPHAHNGRHVHATQPAIVSLVSSKSSLGPAGGSSGSSFKFAVVGDTQGLQYLERLTTDMNAHNPALAVYPGDLVEVGNVPAWNQWKSLSNHFIGGPTMRLPVPGNHDLPVGGDAAWQQTFDWLPDSQVVGGAKGIDKMDYYVDFQSTRFISVTTDSQAHGNGGLPAAMTWLQNVLNDPATQAKEHVFVYSHHPITFNNYDGTGGTYGPWWQAMAQSGAVDAVFVGHWHQYQPSQPDPYHDMWETIAGTGNAGFSGHAWQNKIGYTLVEVDGPRVTASFYGDGDNDGSYDDVLDSFVMSDPLPRPQGVVAYYGFHDPLRNVDAAPAPLGKSNTGGYVGDAITVAGSVRGSALRLDGVGDYAYGAGIGDYNLSILRDLTISIRANFDGLAAGPDGNTLVSHTADVAGYTDREEAVNQPYNLRIRSDRRLEFFWERNNNLKSIFTSTIPASVAAGEWHEYRVLRDATTGEVRFFVDGIQLGEALAFDPLTQLPTGGAQGTLHIGVNYNRDATPKFVGNFDGLLDELVIWNMVTTDPFSPPDIGCGLFADVNLDCTLDARDWLQFRGGQHVSMVGLTTTQATALGDLNGDFRNDHRDFVLFKTAYDAAHGTGALARLLEVPEPMAMALVALTSTAGLARRFKRVRFSQATWS